MSRVKLDLRDDPTWQRYVEEERAAKARGATREELWPLFTRRGRYQRDRNIEYRRAHPDVGVEEARLAKALDGDVLEQLVGNAASWMRGRGFELLTRSAEGVPCACCAKCKVSVPDLRAIGLLAETVNKAITLELARIEAKRTRKEGPETVELEWLSEGGKS